MRDLKKPSKNYLNLSATSIVKNGYSYTRENLFPNTEVRSIPSYNYMAIKNI